MVAAYEPAAAYDERIAPKYDAIAGLLAEVFPTQPAGVLLEQAVGTGALTRLLTARASATAYLAVDASAAMLRIAQQRVPPEVLLARADVRRLPLADASVDLVVSSLGPVQDLPEAITETRRVLVPGGRLLATMWGDDYAEYRLLQDVRDRFDGGSYPTDPFPAARQRLADAGFTDVEVTVHQLPVRHESIDDYVAYRAAFGCPPWLTEDRFDELLAATAGAAADYTGADGAVNLDWQIGVISAAAPGVGGA